MPIGLEFGLAPERLDEGSPEERAAFGLFTVRTARQSLTEGFDSFLNGFRQGPLVSGYHVAEWLAWNWWRLRWEPRSASPDWSLAHRMNSIGEGYLWPNIEIWSDGVRTMLISNASAEPDAKPFRYVGSFPTIVPSTLFEAALDEFLPRVIGRLREQGVGETNLDRLWRDVIAERADPEIAKRRRLEALMGRDPDAIDDDAVEGLIGDADRLGEAAVLEVAAERARMQHENENLLTARGLEAIAQAVGYHACARDMVALDAQHRVVRDSAMPAWKLGTDVAYALRQQERLGDHVIDDHLLATLSGTSPDALTEQPRGPAALPYALDDDVGDRSLIVLPGKREVGRRFALARVLGDRLMNHQGALHPATHAYTYRQKAQRSFAAEFLAPFDSVEEMLRGDYSEENQQDVAEHFHVSPMVVNTLLKNHGRIERDWPEEDFMSATG
ncbi:ImmA/IrrE family metallo-endopeptidase [Sphingomonas sanxanigenens]|uniref:ImmA/IrrE family metallo-endopeptidase n=1 Tax=Sphingomonas sanxanigenens TaxID=397260 RepID=UPI0004BBD03B|nr:hypothetical protein [Sphingomonas sanxanigenens]